MERRGGVRDRREDGRDKRVLTGGLMEIKRTGVDVEQVCRSKLKRDEECGVH